jgi:hypothetical protein
MHWSSDCTGRFVMRPSYGPEELEQLCEYLLTTFLRFCHGHVPYPVATANLIVLVAYLGGTLEWSEARGLSGSAQFLPGRRPRVCIARPPAARPQDAQRVRTLLAHMCGHIWLHRPVAAARLGWGPLVPSGGPVIYRCRPATILGAPTADWAEWQAGYVAGVLLMPVRALGAVIQHALAREPRLRGPFSISSLAGQRLVQEIMAAFAVSEAAARVRLLQRGVLTEEGVVQGELFA